MQIPYLLPKDNTINNMYPSTTNTIPQPNFHEKQTTLDSSYAIP